MILIRHLIPVPSWRRSTRVAFAEAEIEPRLGTFEPGPRHVTRNFHLLFRDTECRRRQTFYLCVYKRHEKCNLHANAGPALRWLVTMRVTEVLPRRVSLPAIRQSRVRSRRRHRPYLDLHAARCSICCVSSTDLWLRLFPAQRSELQALISAMGPLVHHGRPRFSSCRVPSRRPWELSCTTSKLTLNATEIPLFLQAEQLLSFLASAIRRTLPAT